MYFSFFCPVCRPPACLSVCPTCVHRCCSLCCPRPSPVVLCTSSLTTSRPCWCSVSPSAPHLSLHSYVHSPSPSSSPSSPLNRTPLSSQRPLSQCGHGLQQCGHRQQPDPRQRRHAALRIREQASLAGLPVAPPATPRHQHHHVWRRPWNEHSHQQRQGDGQQGGRSCEWCDRTVGGRGACRGQQQQQKQRQRQQQPASEWWGLQPLWRADAVGGRGSTGHGRGRGRGVEKEE